MTMRPFALSLCVFFLSCAASPRALAESPGWIIEKNGVEIDLRSPGRRAADVLLSEEGVALEMRSPENKAARSARAFRFRDRAKRRRGNVQASDGARDNIQAFEGFRPFINFTQNGPSLAVHGRDIVTGYLSTADQTIMEIPGGLQIEPQLLSSFSTSNDGGRTWISGSVPPAPGAQFTFGNASVDVDRTGTFYYAGLGASENEFPIVQVNTSTDGGRSWSPGSTVAFSENSDHIWIAVGRNPDVESRDNIYVVWTSLTRFGAFLALGRSSDDAQTWEVETLFAPSADPNPENPQDRVAHSKVYADAVTGAVFAPFLHLSRGDKDFIRILVSEDGGETFDLATFDIPGAPDPNALPVTQPGTLINCGAPVGPQLAMHAGPDISGGAGLPQYEQAARLALQPALAARDGAVYLAWSNATGETPGDPASGADILFMRSEDGGATWTAPVRVNPAITGDKRHVLPALALGDRPGEVRIAYYTQHADGSLDVDLATSRDGGNTFPAKRVVRVTSQPFMLAPANARFGDDPAATINYDRTLSSCDNLGDHLGVRATRRAVHVIWTDSRNTVTHPADPLDPLSGVTHPQQDIFYKKAKGR